MTEGKDPATYCGRCGNPVQAGDRFCGVCGTPVLPPPQQAEQVIPRQTAASHGDVAGGRRSLAWAVGSGTLALLLVGGAALAFLAPRGGQELAGGADPPQTPGNARGEAPVPETMVQSAPPLEVTTLAEETTDSVAPESTTSYGLEPEGEHQMRGAVEQYYYAVDYENWEYTYYNLDSESKALFTQEEWIAKN